MKERLASLDILRGADMFLLLALGPVVRSICKFCPDGTAWLLMYANSVSDSPARNSKKLFPSFGWNLWGTAAERKGA